MTNNQNQPKQYDAVLGGNAPPPIHGAVLGGVEGVKKRLSSSNVDVQIAALNDAFNYGDVGLDLVVDALKNKSTKVRKSAYEILGNRSETEIKKLLWCYEFSSERVYETLNEKYMYVPFKYFYNREVKFDDSPSLDSITENDAYVTDEEHCSNLINKPLVQRLEAVVFWSDSEYNLTFISNADRFTNLKALFIGAYEMHIDFEIYTYPIWNISIILKAFPKLELLQLRCGQNDYPYWRNFTQLEHHNLKALILETKELSREQVSQIFSLELPELKHLELWLGSENYDEDTSTEYLTPILSGEIFPKLYYLGLRNCEYADEIATAIVHSPIINKIKILDLSLGFLTDAGAEALLNCPAVNDLDILNVANNCLTKGMVDKLMQFDTEVVADNQDINKSNRYESVWE